MKKSLFSSPVTLLALRRKGLWAAAASLLWVGLLAQSAFAGGNPTNSTAQSVMFDTKMNGTFLMTDTQVFEYNKGYAAAYFSNAWDKVAPTGQVQGQAHGTTPPAAPPAPAPIDTYLNGSINGNSCVFWNGGTLAALGNTTYTQELYLDTSYSNYCSQYDTKSPYACKKYISGTDTYKYVYNYTITVNGDGSVPGILHLTDFTNYPWQLTDNTPGGSVTVTLAGNIAAETTVKKSKGNDPWTFKTAFNLPDAIDPLTGQFIGLNNIVATLTDATGLQLDQRALANTIQKGVDFYYAQNAGYNGPLTQLVDNAYVSAIELGEVFANDKLTKDDFAGNNGTLGDLAVLTPTDFTISAPGDYMLTITGTLQGVAGALPLKFSVTQSILYETAENACPAIVQ
jgi:hypothetical protein